MNWISVTRVRRTTDWLFWERGCKRTPSSAVQSGKSHSFVASEITMMISSILVLAASAAVISVSADNSSRDNVSSKLMIHVS